MRLLKSSALSVFILLFCIGPIAFCLLPIIPALITDNENWLWFFIITFPVGLGSCDLCWGHGLDWAFDTFMEDE